MPRCTVSRIVWIAVLWLAAAPVAAQTSPEVVVFVEDGPLRAPLRIELVARGLAPHFEAPVPDPARRAAASGAPAALWIEGGWLVAWSTAHPEGARVQVSTADPATLAVVAAAIIEELSSSEVPAPPLLDTGYHVPSVGLYTGLALGAFMRFVPSIDGFFSVRTSLGMQWIEGLRIGVVLAGDGYFFTVEGGSHGSAGLSGGLELGARLGDDLLAFHFGAHALFGQGRAYPDRPNPSTPFTFVAGVYVGAGLWADPRVELGLRAEGEIWEEPGHATTPVLRLSARIEWR